MIAFTSCEMTPIGNFYAAVEDTVAHIQKVVGGTGIEQMSRLVRVQEMSRDKSEITRRRVGGTETLVLLELEKDYVLSYFRDFIFWEMILELPGAYMAGGRGLGCEGDGPSEIF